MSIVFMCPVTGGYELKLVAPAKVPALFSMKKITASCFPLKVPSLIAEIKVTYKLSSLIPCRPHTLNMQANSLVPKLSDWLQCTQSVWLEKCKETLNK